MAATDGSMFYEFARFCVVLEEPRTPLVLRFLKRAALVRPFES